MQAPEPRYSKGELARRGQAIYEMEIRPSIAPGDHGKFVAIDIETGAYEIDRDDYTATEGLLIRQPSVQIWLLRVGHGAAYRIGGQPNRKVCAMYNPQLCAIGRSPSEGTALLAEGNSNDHTFHLCMHRKLTSR